MNNNVLYRVYETHESCVDEQLLKQTTQVLGERTYSATVNRALAEALPNHKIQNLFTFFGSGLWEGDLSADLDRTD